jgi:hypothetical protein
MDGMSSPFRYTPDSPFEFNGAAVGSDITAEDFNSTAIVVVVALERGYYLMHDFTPLSTNDWARLTCTMLAAIGCGYYWQHSLGQESALEEIRAQALDPSPLTPKFPTLFHQMVATADHLKMQTGTDQDNYQDWILMAKMECMEKAAKAATTVAEEQWHLWKANQIEGQAAMQEAEIAAAVKQKNATYFTAIAAKLGLHLVAGLLTEGGTTPIKNKKCTVLGSTPSTSPHMPLTIRIPAHGGSSIASPTTPCGRTTIPASPTSRRTDPSPTPHPKRAKTTATLPEQNNPTDLTTILAKIQQTLTPIAARLDALEWASMPPLPPLPSTQQKGI